MNADEKYYCPDHALCLERQANTANEIKELKIESSNLKNDIQDMKMQQIKDNERIVTLFNIMGEIKDYIKEIKEEMKRLGQKPNPFDDWVKKLGLKIFEYAIMSGLLYGIAKGVKLI